MVVMIVPNWEKHKLIQRHGNKTIKNGLLMFQDLYSNRKAFDTEVKFTALCASDSYIWSQFKYTHEETPRNKKSTSFLPLSCTIKKIFPYPQRCPCDSNHSDTSALRACYHVPPWWRLCLFLTHLQTCPLAMAMAHRFALEKSLRHTSNRVERRNERQHKRHEHSTLLLMLPTEYADENIGRNDTNIQEKSDFTVVPCMTNNTESVHA